MLNSVVAWLRAVSYFSLLAVGREHSLGSVSGERRSCEERVREPERRNLSSFLPLICIILHFHSPRMALRKKGRSPAVYVVACSRRSNRGDSAKRCQQKETTRGRGKVFFSPSSLAPHCTIRTPGTGFLRSSKKHVLYMPPSVNDLVLRSLREGVSYFFSFCNKEKRRRLYAG